ncbi:DUF2489 domain-containing protein [Alginatibacterium sediminis]|nr:DUF2489 domain-containing protein [Alginatibacterium sediminis]
MLVLGGLGLIVVIGLAVYAGRLLAQLKIQQNVIKAAVTKRNNKIVADIQYIALAMLEGRCEISEGVIRQYHLLNALQSSKPLLWSSHFPSTYALYEIVGDLARLEQRKQLKANQRFEEDKQRLEAEEQYQESVLLEANSLKELELSQYIVK